MEKERKWICVAIAMLIAGILTGMLFYRRCVLVEAKVEKTQEKLAEEVLRFHVLANSDSKEDQKLKLKVKEDILVYLKQKLPNARSVEEAKKWTGSHEKDLEQVAEKRIREEGYFYSVKAKLTESYFPQKTYGDVTFPAGKYEALRIKIGRAKGHNWWCVLYPNLCFIDATNAIVPKKSKLKLKSVLDEEEYEMVTATSKFKMKWFFFGKK
ncbi:stage II sporulation protein R [Faecalimonas sp.]